MHTHHLANLPLNPPPRPPTAPTPARTAPKKKGKINPESRFRAHEKQPARPSTPAMTLGPGSKKLLAGGGRAPPGGLRGALSH